MQNKLIAPAALNALKEALTNIYWYKPQLNSFLMYCLNDNSLISKLDWNDYKRNIVSQLIDYMAKYQDTYKNDLLKLMSEVVKIKDFSHLERLEDGAEKAKKARDSVKALASLFNAHNDILAEQKEIEEKRKTAFELQMKNKGVAEKLESIKKDYFTLLGSDNPQTRGFKLESIIKELFVLFDLDPKASFRIEGEQIDGAFTFENTDYLFEGKWQKELVGIQDLDAFSGKLSRKLENTLGLFLSINGFSEDAIKAHSVGRKLMILMDGADLMAVLDGRIDLVQLLYRKRRHAALTGNIYLRLHDIFDI